MLIPYFPFVAQRLIFSIWRYSFRRMMYNFLFPQTFNLQRTFNSFEWGPHRIQVGQLNMEFLVKKAMTGISSRTWVIVKTSKRRGIQSGAPPRTVFRIACKPSCTVQQNHMIVDFRCSTRLPAMKLLAVPVEILFSSPLTCLHYRPMKLLVGSFFASPYPESMLVLGSTGKEAQYPESMLVLGSAGKEAD